MKKTIFALTTATILGASPLVATGAFAMSDELTMLEQAVSNRFAALGIEEFSMGDLTLQQLSEIRVILTDSDYSRAKKKQQIEAVINR